MNGLLKTAGLYSGVGLQLSASVLSGFFLGDYLDDKFACAPVFVLLGVTLGSILGFWQLWRVCKRVNQND